MRIESIAAWWSLALVLGLRPATALDPRTRITQYFHTAWRVQDGAFEAVPRAVTQSDPQLSYTYKGLLSQSVPNPFCQYLTPATFPGQLRNQKTVTVGSLLTIYPQYGTLQQLNTPGIGDHYQALQLRVQRRFTNALSLLWTYNYNREATQNWFNAPDQYANRFTYIDSNNPRHRMNIAGSYDLPFGKGRSLLSHANRMANAILGGWSSSWIFTYVSGDFLRFGQLNVHWRPRHFQPDPLPVLRHFGVLPSHPVYAAHEPVAMSGRDRPAQGQSGRKLSKFFPLQGDRLRLEFKMEAYSLSNSFMASDPSTDVYSSLCSAARPRRRTSAARCSTFYGCISRSAVTLRNALLPFCAIQALICTNVARPAEKPLLAALDAG